MTEEAGEGANSNSRNFRSAYYEKLGFCGNEEKNVLDLLIASCPFDTDKLNEFCERFDFDRRCVDTWKILLGVECDRKNPFDEFANVKRVRTEHFMSLKHNLEVLLRHNVVIKNRLKKSSILESKPLNNHKGSQENCLQQNNLIHNHNHQQAVHETSEIQPQPQANNKGVETEQIATNHEDNDKQSEPLQNKLDGQENNVTKQDNATATTKQQQQPAIDNNGVANLNSHTSENMAKSYSGIHNKQNSSNLLQDIQTNPGRQLTLMYLLEAGILDTVNIDAQLESANCQKMSAMASFFANVATDLQEAFFLFRNFTRILDNRNKGESLI